MPATHDYYEVLQVSPNADAEIIQAAYRRLAIKWHPDKNPGDPFAYERMRLLNEAYETLSDSRKRREYDARRESSGPEPREARRQGERTSRRVTEPSSPRPSGPTAPSREPEAAKQAEEKPESWHWHVALFVSALAIVLLTKVAGFGGFWALLFGTLIGKGIAMLLVPHPKGEPPDWARGIWGSNTASGGVKPDPPQASARVQNGYWDENGDWRSEAGTAPTSARADKEPSSSAPSKHGDPGWFKALPDASVIFIAGAVLFLIGYGGILFADSPGGLLAFLLTCFIWGALFATPAYFLALRDFVWVLLAL